MEAEDFMMLVALFLGFSLLTVWEYALKEWVERWFARRHDESSSPIEDAVSAMHDLDGKLESFSEKLAEFEERLDEAPPPRRRAKKKSS